MTQQIEGSGAGASPVERMVRPNEPTRAAFEVWFSRSRRNRGANKRVDFARLPDGTYADDHTQRHWWTWQMAQRAAKQPIADEALWEMWVDSPSDVLAYARRIEKWHGIGA